MGRIVIWVSVRVRVKRQSGSSIRRTVSSSEPACFYYATYEYLHWCMHKPKHRVVERSGIFFLLNGHHLLHHRYMNKNFNVVLPLADLCLGTLIVRSKVCFAQARGEGVPVVQPNAAVPVE